MQVGPVSVLFQLEIPLEFISQEIKILEDSIQDPYSEHGDMEDCTDSLA
jgi:hypothetical protein